jgi:L-amino acid N-acyltransferase
MQIRSATEADLPEILPIYNEVIANSTAIYSEQPVTLEDRVNWFRARREQQYPLLVATDASGVVGFSSFGDFRAWPCYRFTVEHSVHVRADQRSRGIGRALIEVLVPEASALGKHVLIAGIDASNIASLAPASAAWFRAGCTFSRGWPQVRSLARSCLYAAASR